MCKQSTISWNNWKKYLIVLVIPLLFFVHGVSAQEQKVSVNIDIIGHEIKDSLVVGDHFYYLIKFNNFGKSLVNDTITISVFNPSGKIVNEPKTYELQLEPKQEVSIEANGSRDNEKTILPFDTAGDYKLEIISSGELDFYRIFNIRAPLSDDKRSFGPLIADSIRQNKIFYYFFDVIPRWQYDSLKKTNEANKKIIEANNRSLELNTEIEEATQSMKRASWIMVLVAVITLIVTGINLFKKR